MEGKRKSPHPGSTQKLKIYISDVLKSRRFQIGIAKLRIKHKVPLNGFRYVARGPRFFEGDVIERDFVGMPPPQWPRDGDKKALEELEEDVMEFSVQFGIFSARTLIAHYLLFNEVPKLTQEEIEKYSLLRLEDVASIARKNEICKQLSRDGDVLEYAHVFWEKHEIAKLKEYPVSLLISPYASIRDIIHFVERNSQRIKERQTQYKKSHIKIEKVRRRDSFIEERNQFIYENRALPSKKLRTLLREKYGMRGILDPGHLTKIISLEVKKRTQA